MVKEAGEREEGGGVVTGGGGGWRSKLIKWCPTSSEGEREREREKERERHHLKAGEVVEMGDWTYA